MGWGGDGEAETKIEGRKLGGGKDRLLPYLLYWLLDSCALYSGCRRYREQDTQCLPFSHNTSHSHRSTYPVSSAWVLLLHQTQHIKGCLWSLLMCWPFFVTLACKSHTEDIHFAMPNVALSFLNTSHCCLGPSGAEEPLGQKALFSSMYPRHEGPLCCHWWTPYLFLRDRDFQIPSRHMLVPAASTPIRIFMV